MNLMLALICAATAPTTPTCSAIPLRLRIDFRHIDPLIEIAQQPAAEIIGADPEEIIRIGPVAVALARQDELIEALVGLDQRVRQPHGVGHVDVVVHVAGGEQQVALQVLRELGILVDGIFEFHAARRACRFP